jgi:predicted transcriptional regulator
MAKRERSPGEIIQDMLLVTLEEKMASKTRIMQKSYLNQKTFLKYFSFLLDKGYISRSPQLAEKYLVSTRGREVLEQLKEVNGLICFEET